MVFWEKYQFSKAFTTDVNGYWGQQMNQHGRVKGGGKWPGTLAVCYC